MSSTETPTAHMRTEAEGSPDVAVGLLLTGIVKTFPGVRALSDVNLEVRRGEVHALVGENGAGKSTLMAVASGALVPDEGTVEIAGQALDQASPDEARRLGLAIVRQHPALLPDLTVAENMAIGVGRTTVSGLRSAPVWAQAALDPWHMGINARSRVSDLSVEQQFIVEIAKALLLEPKVLVLDEPTEHLNQEEVARLFRRVRSLTDGNAAVVYISHRIPEVKEIADRITVLRDGKVRGTFMADDVTEGQIVELVIGRALDTVFPPKGAESGSIGVRDRLVVEGLTGRHFQDVSFSVKAGEVIGLAGVQGNGQAELIRALAGMDGARGRIVIDGKQVRTGSAAAAAAAGVVYVPADRHAEGLFLPLSVGENISMKTMGQVSRAGVMNDAKVAAVAAEQIAQQSIKTPSSKTSVSSLSGGNQQKVVLARTMLAAPSILLAEEPTQGVDAGARVDIYKIIRGAADKGAAVVLLSSDGIELEGLCDRIFILSRGRVVRELVGSDVSEHEIAHAALTSTVLRNHETKTSGSNARVRNWMRGDHSPAAVLALAILLIAGIIGKTNSAYFSSFNLSNILFSASLLILVGAAQQTVVMGSGIDLTVGPLMSFLTIIASFQLIDGGSTVLGLGLLIGATVILGLLNGFLVTKFDLSPVVVTLALALALQGLLFTLRGTPGGQFSATITDLSQWSMGAIPVMTIVAVMLALLLEVVMRRTRFGVQLRAVGSNKAAAQRLGINTSRVHRLSYLVGSLLLIPASLALMSQIGVGDGRPGLSFTLSSVTVVVLAGASIFGGRGSYVGIIAAGTLVAQVLSAPTFLGLSGAWGYLLPGLIVVAAAVMYAQLRGIRGA